MRHNVAVIGLSVLAVLLGAVLVVFAFGTPQSPRTSEIPSAGAGSSPGPAPASSAESASGGSGHGDVGEVTTGTVPAPDPSSPLAIEIPGCVCHSDDPKIVEEHASYRMNQCFGCHSGPMPGMGG